MPQDILIQFPKSSELQVGDRLLGLNNHKFGDAVIEEIKERKGHPLTFRLRTFCFENTTGYLTFEELNELYDLSRVARGHRE